MQQQYIWQITTKERTDWSWLPVWNRTDKDWTIERANGQNRGLTHFPIHALSQVGGWDWQWCRHSHAPGDSHRYAASQPDTRYIRQCMAD